MTIEFSTKSSPYRKNTAYSIGYSNRSDKVYQAINLIYYLGAGYHSTSYNDCRAENINYSTSSQSIYTVIDDIKGMLEAMFDVAIDIQSHYKLLWGKDNSDYNTFSKWNNSNEMCGYKKIKVPAIQVGFVYQSQWLTYNRKGTGEYLKYFPGYSIDRYADAPEATALSHQNYIGNDWRFNYRWYCNNMKYVKHEFFRCNLYNLKYQYYNMWGSERMKEQYSKVKTWSDPLKGFGDKFSFQPLNSEWK